MSSGIHTKEYGYVNRRSMRLDNYDYSRKGAYYITICVQNRDCLFGNIENGKMTLNEWGRIVKNTWNDLVNHINAIKLDEFVIMPNHIHGIIIINDTVGAGSKPAPRQTTPTPTRKSALTGNPAIALPEIVRQFKTFAARRINLSRKTPGTRIWQRNYYDRIVRNKEELNRIRQYIIDNPLNWHKDKHYRSHL